MKISIIAAVAEKDRALGKDNKLLWHIPEDLQHFKKITSEKDKEEIFFIGGGQIYAQAIKFADKLYLTLVEGDYDADTFFPDYSKFKKVVFEEKHESAGYKYKFLELER